jgi:hypothetical protein
VSNFLAEVNIGEQFAPATKFGSLASLVNLLSKVVALGGGFFVVVSVAYVAYLYLSSNGDTKNTEKAKTVITNAIIGMIVISVSYWLTQIIAKFLGQSF